MHKTRLISPRTTKNLKILLIVYNTAVKGNAKEEVCRQLSHFPFLVNFLSHSACLVHLRALSFRGFYDKHLMQRLFRMLPQKAEQHHLSQQATVSDLSIRFNYRLQASTQNSNEERS